MGELPTGTITFLFSDIEGSTRLLRALGSQFESVLERHRILVREAVQRHGGFEISADGDSFFCVFNTAQDALTAAVDIHRAMEAQDWPDGHAVRVRIGVHTGVAAIAGDSYVGLDVHRASRISETGHGGQVILSAATRLLGEAGLPDGVTISDLGEFHLKDLDQPEHLFQLVIEGLDSVFPPLQHLDSGPTNLSAGASTFVGRDRERQEVQKLLDESRLVTITGVAGAGKSRLAVEVANSSRGTFHDGVWHVELAPVRDDGLVARAVANAIGLQESPGRLAIEVLVDYLREGKRLCVFDNCEHVVDGVGELAGRLLAAGQELRILATSRQVLGISGETRYPCPPLAVPELPAVSPASVLDFDSVELFDIRAREVDPTFRLDDTNAPIIAEICQRLDGMPLAIELAAALVRILTPQEIVDRLDRRFELLKGGPRTAPTHQQTLGAALDSTFELLDERQQEFAARLGVFVGSFDVEAAEAVASGGIIDRGDVIDALTSLVDRSLITSIPRGGELRLTILESVRQYLLAELDVRGQLEERQLAHQNHFAGLIEVASMAMRGPNQETWARRLETDIENVRAAIAFAAEKGDEAALELVNRMFLYWLTRGEWSDALFWCRLALSKTSREDSGLRARVLATAGFFASDLGDAAERRRME